VQGNPYRSILEVATAAAMDALPERLSVREMAAAAGVSLWSLQRAFAQASRLTPVAHVQRKCLQEARRELQAGAPGDTVFAVARRWGFTSCDGAFREGYHAAFRELPSDTLRRARAPKRRRRPVANDHVVCLECGRKMRRLRRHLAIAHALTPAAYRQRAGLPHDYPLVCVELSREIAKRARANDLARQGARARKPWNNAKALSRRRRINGAILPSALLVSKAEELVLAALPVRLSERYLADKLGVGRRTLQRSFLDHRGVTAYVALRQLRMREAQRRIQAQPGLALKMVAQQCGFGHYARFRQELETFMLRPQTGRRRGISIGPDREPLPR
jgi:transcriptional regulator GlxA family with amidase domain